MAFHIFIPPRLVEQVKQDIIEKRKQDWKDFYKYLMRGAR